ncbi:hypothetical protein AB0K35_27995 [Micromonospora sp. NPDC053740]|uniref:hypothetical protein n=1 Tax=Micromonospora sp. NPDC053740 TaxID=3155173 RepID=UPI00343F96A6
MTYPTDDLTPLFAAQPAATLGYRQGIVRAWNPTNAENTVEVDGTLVENLTILNTNNDALQLAPDDVVGILTTGAAASSWMILGRATTPGTPAAESLLSQVSSGIASAVINTQQSTTSGTYTDLATPGPSATVTIRATGKCLVILSSQMGYATAGSIGGCKASFVASGANTIATSGQRSINMVSSVGAPSTYRIDQFGATFYLDGLNPGATTFTMKYGAQNGATADFSDRVIVVFPL